MTLRLKKILSLVAILMVLITPVAAQEPSKYIHVDRMTAQVKGDDIEATVYFKLDGFAKVYVMLFGSKTLENGIESFFSSFDDVEVVKIGQDRAIVRLNNVLYKEEGYMLFQEKELSGPVNQITIVFPDGGRQELQNTDTIPNLYYKL